MFGNSNGLNGGLSAAAASCHCSIMPATRQGIRTISRQFPGEYTYYSIFVVAYGVP
jgi:hypothetical protein